MSAETIYVVYQTHPRDPLAWPVVAARDEALAYRHAHALAEGEHQNRYMVSEVKVVDSEPERVERWVADAVVDHETRVMEEMDTRKHLVWSYDIRAAAGMVPSSAPGRQDRGQNYSVLVAAGATEQEALDALNRLYDDLCLHLSLETAGRG